MPDPSFNGLDIFGPCPSSNRTEGTNSRQRNGYPGVSGLEILELGWRESYTDFTGVWVGETPDDLGVFIADMIALKRSGIIATLVDTLGVTSVDAILEGFQTSGETKFHPGYGWGVDYALRFMHTGYIPPSS